MIRCPKVPGLSFEDPPASTVAWEAKRHRPTATPNPTSNPTSNLSLSTAAMATSPKVNVRTQHCHGNLGLMTVGLTMFVLGLMAGTVLDLPALPLGDPKSALESAIRAPPSHLDRPAAPSAGVSTPVFPSLLSVPRRPSSAINGTQGQAVPALQGSTAFDVFEVPHTRCTSVGVPPPPPRSFARVERVAEAHACHPIPDRDPATGAVDNSEPRGNWVGKVMAVADCATKIRGLSASECSHRFFVLAEFKVNRDACTLFSTDSPPSTIGSAPSLLGLSGCSSARRGWKSCGCHGYW